VVIRESSDVCRYNVYFEISIHEEEEEEGEEEEDKHILNVVLKMALRHSP
jgi:hypothetical protein